MSEWLYHYTCDHAHLRIGANGMLLPARMVMEPDSGWPRETWPSQLVWATDLSVPVRDALGLTSLILKCDRTEHRYRVRRDEFVRWVEFRKRLLRLGLASDVEELEGAPGARPAHWYVSAHPVPAVYSPISATRPGGQS